MNPDPSQAQWERLEDLFHQAILLSGPQRAKFLDQTCCGNEVLRAKLEELLQADAQPDGLDATAGTSPLRGTFCDPVAVPGAQIGAYCLVKQIGTGGMGTVWLAYRVDHQFEQRVAIKLIKPGMATEDVLRRFRRERQVLARLEHPNIARLLDGGATPGGRPFLVMEYIVGETITEYAAIRELELDKRLELFMQVCGAVHYAHQNLVVHRDLKPTNILVSPGGAPKLLDFGIAKILHPGDDADTSLTTVSELRLLTPRYASPEQIRNERVTTASDVYSLGVLLYELITGMEPYELTTRSRAEYERAIREQEPRRPSELLYGRQTLGTQRSSRPTIASLRGRRQRSIAADLDTIVLKALRKEPRDRYSSAQQLADDLERLLAGLPVLARRQTLRYQAMKFIGRNKAAVLATAAALVLLIAGAITSATFAIRENRQRTLAEARLHQAHTQQSITKAINEFLNKDLLAGAGPQQTPDRQATIRSVLDAAAQKIGDRFHDQPLVEASIRSTLGATYESLGEYESANVHYLRALELYGQFETSHLPDFLEHQVRVGNIKRLMGQSAEAESLIRPAIERAETTLGPDHPTTLYASHFLAETYLDQAHYDEAEKLFKKTIDRRAVILGDEHDETLTSMGSLAVLYDMAGRLEEAERLDRKLVDIHTRKSGPDNPATIASINNAAYHLMNQGKYEAAEPLFVTAIERGRRVLGAEHPSQLTHMENLGRLYMAMGRYAQAEMLIGQAFETRARLYGREHPETMTAFNNLGLVYLNRKQFESAEPVFREIADAFFVSFGADHPNTISARNNLAFALMNLERWNQAESLFADVVRRRHTVLGPDHPDTLAATGHLAFVRSSLGNSAEARVLLEDAIQRARKNLPQEHPILGTLAYRLGQCLTELGQYELAEESLNEARQILLARFGAEHDRVASVQLAMEKLIEARGQEPDAAQVTGDSRAP